MAGILVGEVIAACEAGIKLTQGERLALIAVAEKCHPDTRSGSVRKSWIQAAVGKSERTTERILAALQDRGLIRVVQRGHKSHGVLRAPVYVLPPLMDGGSKPDVLPPKRDVLPPKRDVLPPNSQCASAIDPPLTSDDKTLDGSYMTEYDGIYDDSRYLRNANENDPPKTEIKDVISGLFANNRNNDDRQDDRRTMGATLAIPAPIDVESFDLRADRAGRVAGQGQLIATAYGQGEGFDAYRAQQLAALAAAYPDARFPAPSAPLRHEPGPAHTVTPPNRQEAADAATPPAKISAETGAHNVRLES